MAYSDYGAFVYKNGTRRSDKEDTCVFDGDERLCHGVLGDGNIRVCCYKYGWPTIYYWKDEDEKPTIIDGSAVIQMFGWHDKPFVKKSRTIDEHYIARDYPTIAFEYEGHKFVLRSKKDAPHYEAEMLEPDGTHWRCVYDYGIGDGFEQ